MRRRYKKLGLAFTDEVLKVTRAKGHFQGTKAKAGEGWQENLLPNYHHEEFNQAASLWRVVFLGCLFLVIFFGLFLRLFHLQIVDGKSNRVLADINRVQLNILHAPRGVIYDRNSKVLAENIPGFRLGNIFIAREEAFALEAKNDPRFYELEIDSIRFYPYTGVLAHVLGYVGEISKEELGSQTYQGYRLGDRIGRAGIEKQYESFLKGDDGAEIVEVDAAGKKLRTLRRIEPKPGKNLYISIDADLQKTAYESLKKTIEKEKACCGVVVAEDPASGEILTLVSLPSFDPNAFTDPKRNQEVAKYFGDKNAPLFNRAIAASYPPGSTFKIASTLAGFSSGKINHQTKFEDTGIVSLGPYQFANWFFTDYGKTEGWVDAVKALQRSNDIFFYRLGETIGVDQIAEVSRKLGMGKKLGIDLPEEVDGLVPDGEWKKKTLNQVWYPGDTLHLSIGQGFLLTTPLQILVQTAFIANDGILALPHLATKITNLEGQEVKMFNYQPIAKDIFKQEDINIIKKGLEAVVKTGGTAWPFFNFSIPTAGKTGTAETGENKGKPHAWYVSYAPVEEPKIAVVVLVEKGGQGSSVAAAVVKDIYTWYFNTDKTDLKSLDISDYISEEAKRMGE